MKRLIEIKNSDIPILEELASVVWHEAYLTLLGKEQVEYMVASFQSKEAFKKQLESGYRYYFIEHEGKKVGYVGFSFDSDKLFLSKLYLKKEYHGKGIATFVLNELVTTANLNGLNSIYLTVNKGNARAIRAYEKFGFLKTDSIVTDVGEGYVMDDYVYTYHIK